MNGAEAEDFLIECAVEPEVMARWQYFHALWSLFGADQGRLIADFPKRWLKQVAQRARQLARQGENKPVELQTMLHHLGRPELSRHRLWPSLTERPWNAGNSWLENAQYQAEPFDLIIACAAQQPGPRTLVAGQFLPEDPPFRRRRQQRISRNAQSILRVAARFLTCSRHIRIVEPHFSIDRPDFVATIQAMIACVFERGCCRSIDLIVRRRPEFNRELQQANYRAVFRNSVPEGCRLRVLFFDQLRETTETRRAERGENLHPRFLLSNLGGIQIDYGFDEGGQNETTLVSLMERELWEGYWIDYCEKGTRFDFDPALHIVEILPAS